MSAAGELVVVTGPPGAGKSTVARCLVEQFEPSALVVGDDFFAMIKRGYLAPWTPESNDQNATVVAAAGAAAGRLATGGYTVIHDGVIGPWFRDAFAAVTGLREIRYVMLLPPEDVCVERVQSRSGHGFTDVQATRHMYREFAASEPGDEYIVRSTGPADVIATSIAERVRSGGLVWPTDDGPDR